MQRQTRFNVESKLKRSGYLKRKTPLKRTPWPRRNKFGAVWSSDGEHSYDSLGERARWGDLQLLARAGEIKDLVFKPKIVLLEGPPEIAWHVDYSYTEKGRTVYEDWKPRPFTPRENLLVKLWMLFGPGLLRFTGKMGVIREVMPIATATKQGEP